MRVIRVERSRKGEDQCTSRVISVKVNSLGIRGKRAGSNEARSGARVTEKSRRSQRRVNESNEDGRRSSKWESEFLKKKTQECR